MNDNFSNAGERFLFVVEKLNEARPINEKEFTKEYLCNEAGVDVNAINASITQGVEPSVEDKERLAKAFGINKDWLVFGRGGAVFGGNLDHKIYAHDPMKILLKEKLDEISSFCVVFGKHDGLTHALIIKKGPSNYYEAYPNRFIFHSQDAAWRRKEIIQFYRFLQYAYKLTMLENDAYYATTEEFDDLLEGTSPAMTVNRLKKLPSFMDDILALSELNMHKYEDLLDAIDLKKVISIAKSEIENIESINAGYDWNVIYHNNPSLKTKTIQEHDRYTLDKWADEPRDFRKEFMRRYSNYMKELRQDIKTPKAYNVLRWSFLISEATLLSFYCVAIYKKCALLSTVFLMLTFLPIVVFVLLDKFCFKQMNNEIQEARMKSLQLTIAGCFDIDGLDQVLVREKVEMVYKRSPSYRRQYIVCVIISKVMLILLMVASALIVIDEFSNIYYYVGTVFLFAVFLNIDYKKLLMDDWCLRLLSNDYREWIITKRLSKGWLNS